MKFFQLKNVIVPLLIIALGCLLFLPYLGLVHLFDWDEINFAESAREMIVTGDYLSVRINFLPFHEKPPLFIWFQVMSMKMFGINEFAARFPNAIAGIVTLLVLYFIGKKLYDQRFGLLWVLAYAGSILPHLYFKSGIIDPWFNLFIFLGIYFLILYSSAGSFRKGWLSIVLSAAFAGLAILTKGPVGLLIIGLTALVWMIIKREWSLFLNLNFLLLYALVVLLIGGSWFIVQILSGQWELFVDFILYQVRLLTQEDAGHGGFLLYHFVVLFFGVFPASLFALKSFRRAPIEEKHLRNFKGWMMTLFWVGLILFTLVNTKILHYSSICYIPLTFLAVWVIRKMVLGEIRFSAWMKTLLIFLAFIYGSLVIIIQLAVRYKEYIIAKNWIKDDFAVGNLQADVYWSGWEFLVGALMILGAAGSLIIFRKKVLYQVTGIFVSSMLYVNLLMIIIVPRVEQYSQHAAIKFFKEKSGEDCILDTWRYKSYAHYFYGQREPYTGSNHCLWDKDCVYRTGITVRPVYIVSKNIHALDFRRRHPDFERMYEKNGFVFFRKLP